MPRPQRLKLSYDKKSLLSIVQETYNETFNLKSKIKINYNSIQDKLKETDSDEEFSNKLDKTLELLALESKNIDNKIFLITHIAEELTRKEK